MVKKKTVRRTASRTAPSHKAGSGIWSLILSTLGIYFLVMGFSAQTYSYPVLWDWMAILYYLVGLFIFWLGHSCKKGM